jgi:hypothetical protein
MRRLSRAVNAATQVMIPSQRRSPPTVPVSTKDSGSQHRNAACVCLDDPHGQVDQAPFRPVILEPVDAGLSAVGGAVVDHSEHSMRGGVGLGGHDLVDRSTTRPWRWLTS